MASKRVTEAMALVGALVLVVACGGGNDDEGGDEATDDDPTTTAEATATTLSPEDEVIAAYEQAQVAVEAAFDPPDPDHPDLLASYGGVQLERFQTRLTEYEIEGVSDVLVSKESNPQVVSVEDTAATVEDCMTEVLQHTDTATREPEGEPRTYHQLIRSSMENTAGAWKLVDARTIEETC